MRIISGLRRGKKLMALEGSNTRPTLERVKQAFFNAIQFEIEGRTVLDLFAGSGQIGLEALSRGAGFCFFNDSSANACKIIEKNIKACDFAKISQLTCKTHSECVKIIKNSGRKVSLVFLDPPYGQSLINDSLFLMCKSEILDSSAVIVCESAKSDHILFKGFTVRREYLYSQIKITILDRSDKSEIR